MSSSSSSSSSSPRNWSFSVYERAFPASNSREASGFLLTRFWDFYEEEERERERQRRRKANKEEERQQPPSIRTARFGLQLPILKRMVRFGTVRFGIKIEI